MTRNGKVAPRVIVRTENLTKTFVGIEALAGLGIEVPEGAVFALIGPNGAGKTTAIKTIMNIFRPTSGHAEVLGVDSCALGCKQLSQIRYVSENQSIPEWMRVGYFLSYCKPFYPNWDDEEAAALIRLYELPLDRTIKNLSRGMRVKAALASSLAYRPRLIVLDEPFSGLDVLVREQLVESILERTAESTVLLASHDLAGTRKICEAGKAPAKGREIIAAFKQPNTRWRHKFLRSDQGPRSPAVVHWKSCQPARFSFSSNPVWPGPTETPCCHP